MSALLKQVTEVKCPELACLIDLMAGHSSIIHNEEMQSAFDLLKSQFVHVRSMLEIISEPVKKG